MYGWLVENYIDLPINIAGKNFASFDLLFLRQDNSFDYYIKYRHRFLDPAILYWRPGDDTLPDTETCMKRAGIEGKVAHDAIEDAIVVVKLIRNKLGKNNCKGK
jgi:DNA polymerase III epsilon subunit-like protein